MNDNGISDWTDSVRDGVGNALDKVIAGIPDILAAIVVVVFGVIVGVVLKSVVVRLLKAINIGKLTRRVGLDKVFSGDYQITDLLGDLVKWFFIIVFLLQALTIAHLETVNDVVTKLLAYVPNVLAAAAVVFVGVVVADLTSRIVTDAARALGSRAAHWLGDATRYTIVAIVIFTALAQLGVNTLFLERLYTAIVFGAGLAAALAFGLGGKDTAKDVLDRVRKNIK